MNPGDIVLFWFSGLIVEGKRQLESIEATVIGIVVVPEPNVVLVLDVNWPDDEIVKLDDGRRIHRDLGFLVRQSFVPQADTDPPASGTWTLP